MAIVTRAGESCLEKESATFYSIFHASIEFNEENNNTATHSCTVACIQTAAALQYRKCCCRRCRSSFTWSSSQQMHRSKRPKHKLCISFLFLLYSKISLYVLAVCRVFRALVMSVFLSTRLHGSMFSMTKPKWKHRSLYTNITKSCTIVQRCLRVYIIRVLRRPTQKPSKCDGAPLTCSCSLACSFRLHANAQHMHTHSFTRRCIAVWCFHAMICVRMSKSKKTLFVHIMLSLSPPPLPILLLQSIYLFFYFVTLFASAHQCIRIILHALAFVWVSECVCIGVHA